ncbi:MAG: phage integrase N-terminal SAM-like domain-containing protein, partial [Candidatus Doudnabacteria bacterium]|nr:phage integrase N-terminal SAM-like domain-containing protein [Candidatus Doudnabacteria bacterium]
MITRSQKPIEEYILPFLDYCEIEKGLSNNTQKNYNQYLNLFSNWLRKSGKRNLLPVQLTMKDIWDYRLYLARKYKTPRGGYLSKRSQNYYLIAFRALLDYFSDKDIICLPSSKIKLAKERDENQITFLEWPDLKKIFSIPDTSSFAGLRDRAILEMFFSTGMRISELVSLDKDSVGPLLEKNITQTLELSIVGKGKRVRTVYIS